MPNIKPYDRKKAVDYATIWAYYRNPHYLDFSNFGGDCTNFCSQCLYAGSGVMNYTPVYGWYYISGNNRSPSWTGVNFLYSFLVSNKTKGPFAYETDVAKMEPGDIIQLGSHARGFYHSLVVTDIDGTPSIDTIYISTHNDDYYNRPLYTYQFEKIRFLHIEGVCK